MDPRIRERRAEVARSQGRRRFMVVLACLTLAAMSTVALTVVRSPLFEVRHVDVSGALHTPRSSILAVTGLAAHPTMAGVDTESLARRIEGLPWVARAEVEKSWPSTVEVVVEERTPVAQVAEPKGRWALLDAAGRVLEVSHGERGDLPALLGDGTPGRPGSRLAGSGPGALAVAAALPSSLRGDVSSVEEVSGEVDMTLRSGVEVRLGPPSDLAAKFEATLTVIERASTNGVAVIDVRAPEDPALTPR
jgi:cell division protein FtsQ